ncbi:MAG: bifunctional glutamate N-acetyltransferase/amino-acid acetyltransferase ArgJ [Candidatus Omnitrophota bacterium]
MPIYFKASALACGIKKSGKPDLGLLYSHVAAKASCLFTSNKIVAASIKVNKIHLKPSRQYRAILVNSGNANCFTGNQGLVDAQGLARAVSVSLGIKKEEVLVASTGIIGKRLPVARIKMAIPKLVKDLSIEGIGKVGRAILTTDTFSKEVSVKFNLGKAEITLCGIAKGAGMIAPNLATMLVFMLTDAKITQPALDKALKIATDNSFNCITVDGCMSTNDSVMLLANAAANNGTIDLNKGFLLFSGALNMLCLELAKMIVRDGEGATKFIQIRVSSAKNFKEAKKAALAIANSNLFKTAMYGEDNNFGRIAAAIGASGVAVDEARLKMKVSSLKKKEIMVDVALGQGKAASVVYTSDLTPGYIKINAAYN